MIISVFNAVLLRCVVKLVMQKKGVHTTTTKKTLKSSSNNQFAFEVFPNTFPLDISGWTHRGKLINQTILCT